MHATYACPLGGGGRMRQPRCCQAPTPLHPSPARTLPSTHTKSTWPRQYCEKRIARDTAAVYGVRGATFRSGIRSGAWGRVLRTCLEGSVSRTAEDVPGMVVRQPEMVIRQPGIVASIAMRCRKRVTPGAVEGALQQRALSGTRAGTRTLSTDTCTLLTSLAVVPPVAICNPQAGAGGAKG